MKAVPDHSRQNQVGNEGRERHDGKEEPSAVDDPVALKMGSANSATIHEEWTTVSTSLAEYSRDRPIGAATSRSRSLARKNVESAVMMLESSRIEEMPAG